MVDHLIKHPDQLVDPGLYLDLNTGTIPTPYLKVELNGFGIPKSKLTPPTFRSLWNVMLEGEEYSTQFVLFLPGIKDDAKLLDDLLLVEGLMTLSDLAFSDHFVLPEVSILTRRNLEKIVRKRVFQIV